MKNTSVTNLKTTAKSIVSITAPSTITELQEYQDGQIVEITGEGTVTFRKGAKFGNNCEFRVKEGCVVRFSGPPNPLTLGNNCILDLRDGILYLLRASCTLGKGSSLMIDNFPIEGNGSIIAVYPNGDLNPDADKGLNNGNNNFNYDQGVSLIAPAKRIFNNNIKLEGKWLMPTAYPEWFAEDDCEDWSVPINKAIKLKKAGEVLLPKGFLKVKHTIFVQQGIILRGIPSSTSSSSYNTFINSDKSSYKTKEYTGTYLIPNYNTLSANEFTFGSVILVNFNPELSETLPWPISIDTLRKEDSVTLPIKDPLTGNTIHKSFVLADSNSAYIGTTVKDISFENTMTRISGLRGIFVIGTGTFENLYFRNLSQGIIWHTNYSDSKTVIHCIAAHDHYYAENDNSGFDTPFRDRPLVSTVGTDLEASYFPDEYDVPYAFDLSGLGDALCFKNNHVQGNCINALRLQSCGGGNIDGNILNADVQIVSCKGISFCANHMEEGGQIRIIQSEVSLKDNYIYKGSRPSIVISSGKDRNQSVVSLITNLIIYNSTIPMPFVKPEEISEYDIAVFSVVNVTNTGEKDVQVKYVNDIYINNTFRYYGLYDSFSPMYSFGLKIQKLLRTNIVSVIDKKQTVNSSVVTSEDFESFNKRAHFLSVQSNILPVNNITNYSYNTQLKNEDIESGLTPYLFIKSIIRPDSEAAYKNSNLKWYGKPGIYTYSTQLICDIDRKIAHPQLIKDNFYINVENVSSVTSTEIKANVLLALSIYKNATLPFDTRYIARIIRKRVEKSNNVYVVKETNYVDVPIVGATCLYDDGLGICGFRWKSVPTNLIAASVNINDISDENNTFKAFVYGENNNGNWQFRDILLNLASNQSWQVKVINKQ